MSWTSSPCILYRSSLRRPPEFDKWPLRNYNRYDVRIGRTNLNQHRKGNIVEIGNYLDFDFLIRFLEGLQKFLGEDSEILIHDYRKGYDHTIVYALNADLSGRHVGGSPKGGMITQFGKSIEPLKDSIQTFSNGPKDRFFKSFTTLIPDENGKIIGSVCVNLDVSQLLIAQNALQAFIQHPATDIHTPPATDMDALATKNVDDILQYYMNQAEALVGKPMSLMNKEEKIKALDYLDQKGVFKISKTSVLLCETLQISKYTLYNYLEEARSGRSDEEA